MNPILTLLLFLPTFFVYSQAADSPSVDNHPTKDFKWRTLEANDYSIQYPLDWIADNSGQLGSELFLFSPEESKDDQFIESINLVIHDLPTENPSLEKYTSQSEDELESMITSFNLIENEQLKSQNGNYQRIVYTGDHNKYNLKFVKYYWIVKSKAYVLTFIGEQNGFDGYSKISDKILNSFTIKE